MTIERAYASASDTLDQTSYTQVDSMTITPPSGNYLAVFNMQVRFAPATVTASNLKVQIYVGGSPLAYTVRTINQNSSLDDMYWSVTTAAYVSPNGSQAVEVRYIVNNGSTPMVGTNRELNLFPAPDTNYQDTDVVTDTTTGTWATLDTMTETPAAGTYLALFSATWEGATGDTVGFRLSVGGTPVAHTERQSYLESSASPAMYIIMLMAKIAPGGSDVVKVEWARISGSGTCSCYERNMILIEIPDADIFEASGTVDDTDNTSGSDVAIDDLLTENPGAADYLVFFNSFDFYPDLGSPFGVTTYKIYEGGAEDTNLTRIFEHEDSLDNTLMAIFLSGRVTLGLGTDDIQAYWNANSTVIRTIYERTLIAIREPTAAFKLEGVTYDKDEVILGSVDCYLYKDNLDNTITFKGHVVSNAGTGVYSFTGIADNDANYLVVFIKDDSPHVMDVTDHVLQPVAE